MIFNSLDFAFFLPIVFILYWFVVNRNLKVQNLFLVIVSYVFYGWWDWRFLSLIIFSSLIDYFFDSFHLNKTGAEIFSYKVVDSIKKHLKLEYNIDDK